MLISILRTIVPLVWGNIVLFLLGIVPALEPLRGQLLAYGDAAIPVLAALLTALWYALWRWAEPKLPNWITAVLLGSAKAPVYVANFEETAEDGEPDYLDHVSEIIYDEKQAPSTEDEDEEEPKHLAE